MAEAAKPRDEQAVRQFVERFAAVLAQAGIPLMPSRVFVALLTADAPRLTADDIAGILQVSPAAVSGAVRYLLPLGLVSRETEPGSRRYWYRMPADVWHEVVRLRDQMMMRWSQTLRDGLDLLGPDSPAGQRIERVDHVFRLRAEGTADGAQPLGGVPRLAPRLTQRPPGSTRPIIFASLAVWPRTRPMTAPPTRAASTSTAAAPATLSAASTTRAKTAWKTRTSRTTACWTPPTRWKTPKIPYEDPLDTGILPADKWSAGERFGDTLEEEREGESLDQLLAEEEPDEDPYKAAQADGDLPREGPEPFDEPQPRAGRLVQEDEGLHPDREADLVAEDVGIDGGAASAEEAAVHLTDEDEDDIAGGPEG